LQTQDGMAKTLAEAFVEDHRTLTRGLSRLLELVEAGNYDEASRVAKELDRDAGPHIEFEEKSFYPEVRKARGREYVENLYDEHRSGLEAVRMLSELEPGATLSGEERERLLTHLRRVLDHAVSCGTLLSHVTALPVEDQQGFLEELERFRELAHKWTELHGT
jgi:hypothetical protein